MEKLIINVKGYPHIYDKTKASYKDEIMKDDSWLSIADILKIF